MNHTLTSALLAASLSTTAAPTTCDAPTAAYYDQGILSIPTLYLLNPFDPSYVDATMNVTLTWDGQHFTLQEAHYLEEDAQ